MQLARRAGPLGSPAEVGSAGPRADRAWT